MQNPDHGKAYQTGTRRIGFRFAWPVLLALGLPWFGCDSPAGESGGTAESGGTVGSGGTGGGGMGGSGGTAASAGIGGAGETGGSSAGGATGGGGATAGSAGIGGATGGGGAAAGSAGIGGATGGGGAAAGTAGTGGATGGGGATTGGGGTGASGYDVVVNPYGASPLVAVANLHGVEPTAVVSVEVVVTGQDGGADFTKVYSPTDAELVDQLDTSDLTFPEPGYPVPILGLYADRNNEVSIHVDRLEQDPVDLTLQIASPLSRADEDAWVPSVQINTAVTEQMEPGWTVAEISIEPNPNPPIVFVEWTRSIAFDERGALRWALRLDDLPKGETFTLRRSTTGNFLTGSFDTFVEVTKLGRILRSFRLPDHTLHHEILQIGSGDNCEGVSDGATSEHFGNLLVLASRNDAATIQDRVLELDVETGAVLNEWDLAQILDPTRTTFMDPAEWPAGASDWLHENGLAYSAADESLIVSGRHQGVAKIHRDGTLVWLLAPHRGWNEPQSTKLLTAVSESGVPYDEPVQLGDEAAGDPAAPEFDWAFGQHSPALLPNGDLLLFDNGCRRHWGSPYASYSRAVIYRIDEVAMTVQQVGQFILTRQESSYYVSNTHQLPGTGNILIQPGGSASNPAVVKEVATQIADDGTVAFETVVFDAMVDLSWVDSSRWYVYSFRGHRWAF